MVVAPNGSEQQSAEQAGAHKALQFVPHGGGWFSGSLASTGGGFGFCPPKS